MEITYLGHSSFKLKGKTASVVIDPFDSKMVGFKFPSVDADIVTISHNHDDHNKADLVQGEFKLITGPGEYEIKGISILGFPSFHDDKEGSLRGKNTIYVFEIDDFRICHLGDLGQKLKEEIIENLGDIDILMIPVGGEFTIGSSLASQIVRDIDPSIVIPMHYKAEGINLSNFSQLEPLENFLREVGLTVERLPKLTVKKEDIQEETKKVIVLEKK